jgi:hypothetical protein
LFFNTKQPAAAGSAPLSMTRRGGSFFISRLD